MNNLDKQYFDLLRHILKSGVEKKDRTGTGTISIFDHSIRFSMKEGFPLLTSKKMAWKAMVIELLWFLKGDTNIKFLVDNGCYIWVGDAYKNYLNKFVEPVCPPELDVQPDYYLPLSRDKFIKLIKEDNRFAEQWGELGPVYGKQWRKWEKPMWEASRYDSQYQPEYVDQISDLIKNLKENPDSRRLMVSAWNVSDLDEMVLPPCHYGFQCYTRELTTKERYTIARTKGFPKYSFIMVDGNPSPNPKTEDQHYDECGVPKRALSLKWTQRSCDVFLGIPFNIASYGLLLHLLSKEVNMVPEDLIFSGGDCHIYLNHIDQCKQQLKQKTFKLPSIEIEDKSIFDIEYNDIKLVDYESSPTIKAELSN